MIMKERMAGVLLHPTSLPGSFGIGDLGPSADLFLDWAAAAGMKIWQILPLGPRPLSPSSGARTSGVAVPRPASSFTCNCTRPRDRSRCSDRRTRRNRARCCKC